MGSISKRVLQYLILPFIGVILLGVILWLLKFKYIEQYLIASGPILSAFIALYISKTSEFIETNKEDAKRKMQLRHVLTMSKESIDIIKKEIDNYDKFIIDLRSKGFTQKLLETTPFYFLEEISKYNQGNLYDAILSRSNKDKDNASRVYIDLLQQINNALFTKKNATQQYKTFIDEHNKVSGRIYSTMMQLNELHATIRNKPSDDDGFDSTFFKIIARFNYKYSSGEIDYFSTSDLRKYLYSPLLDLMKTIDMEGTYIPKLGQIVKELEVNLEKMDDVREIAIVHFTDLKTILTSVHDRLIDQLQILS